MPRRKVGLIDANIVLRHLLDDDPEQAPRARVFMKRLEMGAEAARLEDVTLAEVGWVLQKGYKVPRKEITRRLLALVRLRGILCRSKSAVLAALEQFGESSFDIADCLLAAHARNSKATVHSFDED